MNICADFWPILTIWGMPLASYLDAHVFCQTIGRLYGRKEMKWDI